VETTKRLVIEGTKRGFRERIGECLALAEERKRARFTAKVVV